jgi:hypothetical protein
VFWRNPLPFCFSEAKQWSEHMLHWVCAIWKRASIFISYVNSDFIYLMFVISYFLLIYALICIRSVIINEPTTHSLSREVCARNRSRYNSSRSNVLYILIEALKTTRKYQLSSSSSWIERSSSKKCWTKHCDCYSLVSNIYKYEFLLHNINKLRSYLTRNTLQRPISHCCLRREIAFNFENHMKHTIRRRRCIY